MVAVLKGDRPVDKYRCSSPRQPNDLTFIHFTYCPLFLKLLFSINWVIFQMNSFLPVMQIILCYLNKKLSGHFVPYTLCPQLTQVYISFDCSCWRIKLQYACNLPLKKFLAQRQQELCLVHYHHHLQVLEQYQVKRTVVKDFLGGVCVGWEVSSRVRVWLIEYS